jgi:hypothetical protein
MRPRARWCGRIGQLSLIGRRNPLLVKTALVHEVGFSDENVGRDLVFGAAELPEGCEQHQVIEGFLRQSQAQRPGFRAVFGSRHFVLRFYHRYNGILTLD